MRAAAGAALYDGRMAESPIILALELSTSGGGIALRTGRGEVIERGLSGRQRNSAELFDAMRELLEGAGLRPTDIAAAAISIGPGSFTGLRVAVTIARMLCASIGCGVIAVPTLEVIAARAADSGCGDGLIGVVTDAGRGRVYAGAFRSLRSDRERAQLSEAIPVHQSPDSAVTEWLLGLGPGAVATGEGLGKLLPAGIEGVFVVDRSIWPPTAAALMSRAVARQEAGRYDDASQLAPLYVRPPECEEVFELRRDTARLRRELRQE